MDPLTALSLAKGIARQSNLLSTATDEERRAALARFLDWWNLLTVPTLTGEPVADLDRERAAVVEAELRAYVAEHCPTLADPPARELDIHEAAAYLGMPLPTVKYHVHTTGLLHPQRRVGHSLLFTKRELDRFAAVPRPHGPKPSGQSRRRRKEG